jgi:peroxiredoxin 2/4
MSEALKQQSEEKINLPRLNEPAPQFTANTTHGPITLSDYKGKWVVLFSHPADFTPVCTTEFLAFAQKNEKFKKLNTDVIGLSIDSVYSHIAWVRNIEEKFGIRYQCGSCCFCDRSQTGATCHDILSPHEWPQH